uniref:Uncharacterized protein n=1 Tax=Dulem virus 77 TaxID=3145788 RepID=A0AAU8AZW1_9VIRU
MRKYNSVNDFDVSQHLLGEKFVNPSKVELDSSYMSLEEYVESFIISGQNFSKVDFDDNDSDFDDNVDVFNVSDKYDDYVNNFVNKLNKEKESENNKANAGSSVSSEPVSVSDKGEGELQSELRQ